MTFTTPFPLSNKLIIESVRPAPMNIVCQSNTITIYVVPFIHFIFLILRDETLYCDHSNPCLSNFSPEKLGLIRQIILFRIIVFIAATTVRRQSFLELLKKEEVSLVH